MCVQFWRGRFREARSSQTSLPMQEHHVQINPDWDPKVNANFMGTVVNFITLLYILLYVGAACMFLMR